MILEVKPDKVLISPRRKKVHLFRQEMEFQQMLLTVQESLSGDEVQDLVFLCSDLLSLKYLSAVSTASELFVLLETRDLLSPEDPSLLLELLKITKRHGLIRNLCLDAHMQTRGQISSYRQLLFELSESITGEDLKNIKFLLIKTLPRKKLEQDITLLQLFVELEKEDLLNENNLDLLQGMIGKINPSLEKIIILYKTKNSEMFHAQETGNISSSAEAEWNNTMPSPLTSHSSVDIMGEQVDRLFLTEAAESIADQSQHLEFNSEIENESVTENLEIQKYEMEGDWRGFCVIINNYDFNACDLPERKGTDIDQKTLVAVFKWLGFDVLTKQDCSREQILKVLIDLGHRDHSRADCVVCCVLSHGRVDGVVGVDGQIVTFKELMNPLQCPTLYQKPKLFFIQACRGTSRQSAVGPQTNRADDMTVSDAAVSSDTIPEAADYLLAMSTVPHHVSYRDPNIGTWFIQSLCSNLQQLVPRGYDLLSILTKVNFDVSRKTCKYDVKKQMPQPEFTLTKRVVFPVPKTCPPLQ
ncbi:caspase-8 [Xyrauchen texanus]|uniref:caspase-8 n=1 Tax=Xyrauchen texanus TaxID=154827 RepID=UPI0022425E0D|nr:caspase-8 [Xyrauchen texanus]